MKWLIKKDLKKLKINYNHYNFKRVKIVYILLRLKDKVIKYTYARKNFKLNYLYVTVNEILLKLLKIYENVNHKNTI